MLLRTLLTTSHEPPSKIHAPKDRPGLASEAKSMAILSALILDAQNGDRLAILSRTPVAPTRAAKSLAGAACLSFRRCLF